MNYIDLKLFNTISKSAMACVIAMFKGYKIDSHGNVFSPSGLKLNTSRGSFGVVFPKSCRYNTKFPLSVARYQAFSKYGVQSLYNNIKVLKKENISNNNKYDNIYIKDISPINCEQCGKLTKNIRFCSIRCSSTSNIGTKRPEDVKNKISESLKGRSLSEEHKNNMRKYNSGEIKRTLNCQVCKNDFTVNNYNNRKTCSPECLFKLRSDKSVNQKRHGGGHKGTYKGIWFDSTYELAYYIKCLDDGLNISRCEEIRTYYYKNKNSQYNPDFVVDGKIIEVKGFLSERSKAKLEQNLDVILLDVKHAKECIKYVKNKFNIKDLRDLYDEKKTYKFTCLACGLEFESYQKERSACSRKCSGKLLKK